MFYSGVYKTITQLTREVRRVYGTTLEKAASDGYGLKPRTTMAQKQPQRVSFGGGAARAVVTTNDDDAPLATPPQPVKRPAPTTEDTPGAAKRANVDEEEAPAPKFKLSKWDLQPWRTGFVPDVVLEEYEFPLPTGDSDHIRRIYDHASKKHQDSKCASAGTCAWCVAAGAPNFFRGDPKKKSVSLSLYVEAIKTYTLVDEDFDVEFHNLAVEVLKTYGEDLEVLDFNDFFMENCGQMRYCAHCYPEIPSAVEAMIIFQQAPFALKTSMALNERKQALAEFNLKKTTAKKEFVAKLREVAICSHFDWMLHIQSNKHNHRKSMNIDDLPDEMDGVQKSVVSVKHQIAQLELVFQNQMGELMRRMAEKPATPKASQNMLMSETEQFVEVLLHPTGKFKEFLSKLVCDLATTVNSHTVKVVGEVATNSAKNITEVVNSVRANSANIQGLTCEISKVPENITKSIQPVVEKLTAFEERLGKIEEVMKKQLEGK